MMSLNDELFTPQKPEKIEFLDRLQEINDVLRINIYLQKQQKSNTQRRVRFKGDSENLMKPPCEIKVYNVDEAPSVISAPSPLEETIALIRSAGAWRPRIFRKKSTETSELPETKPETIQEMIPATKQETISDNQSDII